MLTLPNLLSFMRAPLALLFLQKNIPLRLLALVAAMLSDFFDGYLARKKQTISRFGSVLDPAMDKFFVYFTLSIFYFEGNLRLSEA
ncbi:MAG: CDP-alcohol phosphatidyltransferase family protein, partial [Parachlamydiales bacterium]